MWENLKANLSRVITEQTGGEIYIKRAFIVASSNVAGVCVCACVCVWDGGEGECTHTWEVIQVEEC